MHTDFKTTRPLALVMSLSLMIVFSAACSGTPEPDPTPKTNKGAAISADPGSLIVYSGRSESLIGPLIGTFQTMTGIDVSVKYGSTGEIATTILEEGSNSPADVFFAQDPGGLAAVTPMLEPLSGFLTKLTPNWARSPEGQWVGVSGRARVVVYNKQNVSEEDIPNTVKGFIDPKWKGRIGWAPSNASFQAMITTMRMLWGEEDTSAWLSSIQANQPKVYLKNTPIVAAAASGEIDVGFVNHYYLHRFMKEDGESFGARNFFMNSDGPGSVILVSGVGILKTTGNRQNAEKFIQFLLSNVAQQYFASQTFEYPLIDGVTTHRLLPSLSELTKPTIDMASLSDIEGTQRLLRNIGIIP
jgi:iron(III) transport system substrate-binding protein